MPPRKIQAARRVVGYVRVSTDDQATNGCSLETQEERIRAYCVASALTLHDIVQDAGASAKSLSRPGLQDLIARIRAHKVGVVVALKLDRLTRSVRDLVELLELCSRYDVALVSVSESLDTGSAAGRMVVHMLGVVAQWEREIIGERTATVLTHRRSTRHVYCRQVPFGWSRDGDALVEDEREMEALRTVLSMSDDGYSLGQIARWLTEQGIAPRGRQWYPASVARILHSRMTRDLFARVT